MAFPLQNYVVCGKYKFKKLESGFAFFSRAKRCVPYIQTAPLLGITPEVVSCV